LKDQLLKMDPIKKERLINAALEEFGNHEFDKASTNVIVKNAGISKGLLYHYFATKDILFEYLTTFIMTMVADAISEGVEWDKGDVLQRMADIIVIKMKIIKSYPHWISFSKKMYAGKSLEEIKTLVEVYMPDVYTNVYQKNIDFSLFRDDIDIGIAMKSVEFTMDKYSETILASFNSPGEFELHTFVSELENYLKLFRTTYYK